MEPKLKLKDIVHCINMYKKCEKNVKNIEDIIIYNYIEICIINYI